MAQGLLCKTFLLHRRFLHITSVLCSCAMLQTACRPIPVSGNITILSDRWGALELRFDLTAQDLLYPALSHFFNHATLLYFSKCIPSISRTSWAIPTCSPLWIYAASPRASTPSQVSSSRHHLEQQSTPATAPAAISTSSSSSKYQLQQQSTPSLATIDSSSSQHQLELQYTSIVS